MINVKGLYFICNQHGHHVANCPTRSLTIDNRKDDKEGDIQEETYVPPTIDNVVEEDEECDQLAMIKLPQQAKPGLGVV